MIRLNEEDISNIESYISEISKRGFTNFDSEESIKRFFNEYMNEFLSNCNYNDIDSIRYYTGIAYNRVNSLLRGKWDYNKNGLLTDDIKKESTLLSNQITSIINRTPTIPGNIVTYRGTNLDSFKKYGIN